MRRSEDAYRCHAEFVRVIIRDHVSPVAYLVNIVGGSKLCLVPWKTSDVAIGVVTLIIVGFLGILIVHPALSGASEPNTVSELAIIGGISGVIMLLIAWLIGPARYRVSLSSLGLRIPTPESRTQLLLPVLVLIASLAFTGIYGVIVSVLGWDIPESLPEGLDREGPGIIGILAVIVVLWVPLAEEVFFRGFLLSGLVVNLGVVGAAIVSSLVFALFHIDPRIMVPIFVTGLLFAWLYNRTGSIWSCSAAHAMQNAVALSISIWD